MRIGHSGLITVAASCFGVCIGVRCPAIYASAVAAELPRGWVPVDTSEVRYRFTLEPEPDFGTFRIKCRARCIAKNKSLASALALLQNEILLTIAEYSTTHVFIHAGVTAWKDRLIIFPGRSYAGKSTLVSELVEAGALYYSDEYAAIDAAGLVHPFPLPIALRSSLGCRVNVVAKRTASSPSPPHVVAFAAYRTDAIWDPLSLTPAETVLNLIRHAVAIRTHTETVLQSLKTVALQSQGFAGYRGDACQILTWLNC